MNAQKHEYNGSEIAVIGLSGRFPGARNINEFWQNLQNGVESISFFSEKELVEQGNNPQLIQQPDYVRAKGFIEDVEGFDAAFFDYTPKEATFMDPQFRLLHECAWEALEDAGYSPGTSKKSIGLFAGAAFNESWLFRAFASQTMGDSELLEAATLTLRDYLCTLVSYKLDLKGPSFTLQTACSTSMVAIHQATQSLLFGECKLAVAGGVSINLPSKTGYLYQEGMIHSPDGHCRPFDAQAAGTVFGDGAGIVVLKRLAEAIADGDHIYAIIRGSAINNDGNQKVGYTAPGTRGQVAVIRSAFNVAEVEPESISYIEAHGTGTTLGDPIEIEALKTAFRTERRGYCRIGSVKSNLGHLNAASGVAGFLKTVLALHHRQIPPTLHYQTPNPQIDFAQSPFVVATELTAWEQDDAPLRAGVSSFGIGGTNAHVILEQAPPLAPTAVGRDWHLLLLSAKSAAALEQMTQHLRQDLEAHPERSLADVAYTLQVGRAAFAHRRMLVCATTEQAVTELAREQVDPALVGVVQSGKRPQYWLFPGQGTQYAQMGRQLYEQEALFRETLDCCLELARTYGAGDLRALLYPGEGARVEAGELEETEVAQPLLFSVEYALARLLWQWGLRPQGMLGHSIGEYVAACLAGVFTLEEAMRLVVRRGQLMARAPRGAMVSVERSEAEVQVYLGEEVSLAAVNTPKQCVLAGSEQAISVLEQRWERESVRFRRLHTSHAFHSALMESVLDAFGQEVRQVALQAPRLPYLSNVTGTWIRAEEATDPQYWVRHLRQGVRFAAGMSALLAEPGAVLLEVGPGKSLSTFARQGQGAKREQEVLNLLRHPLEEQSDEAYLLRRLGRLWTVGGSIDWAARSAGEQRQRLSLPTYPFQRQRFWLEVPTVPRNIETQNGVSRPSECEIATLSWKRLPGIDLRRQHIHPGTFVVFMDEMGIGLRMNQDLSAQGHQVFAVYRGHHYEAEQQNAFTIDPANRTHYLALCDALKEYTKNPLTIVYLWSLQNETSTSLPLADSEEAWLAVNNFALLTGAFHERFAEATSANRYAVITGNGLEVVGGDNLDLTCNNFRHWFLSHPNGVADYAILDIERKQAFLSPYQIEAMISEVALPTSAKLIALRGRHRWVQIAEPYSLSESSKTEDMLQAGATYILSGVQPGISQLIEQLAAKQARLSLLVDADFPNREQWEAWEEQNGTYNEISQIIRTYKRLEDSDVKLLIIPVNYADKSSVEQAVTQAERESGPIRGVFYLSAQLQSEAYSESGQTTHVEHEGRVDSWSSLTNLLALEDELSQKDLDFAIIFVPYTTSSEQGSKTEIACDRTSWYAKQADRERHLNWQSIYWPASNTAEKAGLLCTNHLIPAIESIISGRRDVDVVVTYDESQKAREEDAQSQSGAATKSHVSSRLEGEQIENTITQIWEQMLGVKPEWNENFFDIGGDSLKAASLASRIQKECHVAIRLSDIFQYATVKALSEHIRQLETTEYSAIVPVGQKPYYALSSSQRRTYIIQRNIGSGITYNYPMVIVAYGIPNDQKIAQAFTRLIERHEIFRTTFDFIDGEPVQKVHEHVDFSIEYAQIEENALDSSIEAFIRPFDLSKAPLLRVVRVQLAAQKYALLLDMHNIIADGMSMNIFVKEFCELYKGTELPPLGIQYKDYAEWQQRFLVTSLMQKQETYWLNKFATIPTLAMPLDAPRQQMQDFTGETVQFILASELTEKLHQLAREHNVTVNALFYSIFTLLLHKYSGQTDLVVGSLVAGRRYTEVANLIGLFTNFLPVRSLIDVHSSFVEFLETTSQVLLEAYDHQDYPFDLLVEKLSERIPRNRNPFFDAMFVYHNEHDPRVRLEIEGMHFEGYDFAKTTAKLDLKLDLVDLRNGEYKCVLQYNTQVYNRSTIDIFIAHYLELVQQIIARPERTLAHFKIFTPEEEQKIAEKRTALEQSNAKLTKIVLVVSATFTATPIENHIKWWGQTFGQSVDVQFSAYNQVFQDLLDPASLLSLNTGVNVLLIRFEDWLRDNRADEQTQIRMLEQNFDDLVKTIREKPKSIPYFIGLFSPESDQNLSPALRTCIMALNTRWKQAISALESVYVIDFRELSANYQIGTAIDPVTDRTAHLPFTDEFFAAMGTEIARNLVAWRQHPFKVIALDCDNTLWNGIIDEDGVDGIRVPSPYAELQKFIQQKRREGFILALCSKNNEPDVWAAFAVNRQMILQRDDFVAWRINWQPKSQNLRELAAELQLGLESFIFIDDSASECAEVMLNCPEVLTLQLPQSAQQIPLFLNHLWGLDKLNVTAEDQQRTHLYAAEKRRQDAHSTALTHADFLQSLHLKMSMEVLEKAQVTRVAQMTQRTNQFNLSTIRRNEQQIQELLVQADMKCWFLNVEDRFGHYGITGAVFAKQIDKTLFLDTLLLSCRVLGRNIEEALLDVLIHYCSECGIERIVADYHPTAKNQPVKEFLIRTNWLPGAETQDACSYSLDIQQGVVKYTHWVDIYYHTPLPQQREETSVLAGSVQFQTRESNRDRAEPASESTRTHALQWNNPPVNGQKLQHQVYYVPLEYSSSALLMQLPVNTVVLTERTRPYIAPRNELEKQLCQLWTSVLEGVDVGIDDSFFEVGGNSLRAIKLEVELEKNGLLIEGETIFLNPTVRQYAEKVVGTDPQGAAPSPVIEVEPAKDSARDALIRGIEPFNDFIYKSCFYSSAFPVVSSLKRNIMPFIINDSIVYHYDESQPGTGITTFYQPILPVASILRTQGIVLTTRERVIDVAQTIMQSVVQGKPVVLWVDCFYESIRPDTYHRVHHPHTLLFYGYKRDRQTFHVIEHQHLESPLYEKRELSFSDTQNAYEGFLCHFRDSQPETYYEFAAEPDWVEREDENLAETFKRNSCKQEALFVNGLQALRRFQADFELLVENQGSLQQNTEKLIIGLSEIIKAKQVEMYRLEHLHFDQEITGIVKQIIDSWSSIRSVIAKFQYSGRYSENIVRTSRTHLARIIACEASYTEWLFQ